MIPENIMVEPIPIFDSLAHPTLTGMWLGHKLDARFSVLAKRLEEANFVGACAVGLPKIEGYSHTKFLEACSMYATLVPIAGLDVLDNPDVEMEQIKQMGFRGIKVHPRFAGLDPASPALAEIFRAAACHDLVVFYCTYLHSRILSYPESDPFFSLVRALKNAPQAKVVLVHGGDVQLLRYAELVRFNRNLLLDLSLTMLKYEGSSLDLDIQYLCRKFDERLCIGTDFPEYTHAQLRKRFEHLATDLPMAKIENIGHKNIMNFLEL